MVAAEGVSIIREGQVGPPTMFRISGRVRAVQPLYEHPRTETGSRPARLSGRASAGAVQVRSVPVRRCPTGDDDRRLLVRPGLDRVGLGRSPVPAVDGDHASFLAGRRRATPDRISADTLVVIFGQYYEVGAPPGVNGSIVPAMATIGSGRLLVFTKGRVLDGTWSRAEQRDLVHLHDQRRRTGGPSRDPLDPHHPPRPPRHLELANPKPKVIRGGKRTK